MSVEKQMTRISNSPRVVYSNNNGLSETEARS